MAKPTAAQKKFLREHLDEFTAAFLRRGLEDGYRRKTMVDRGTPTYDFVGRVRTAGWVTIESTPNLSWPFGWAGTRLTEAGREAAR